MSWIRLLFVVAAAYDGVLGLLFLFGPLAAFRWFDVSPPNHVGYVQFPAALLLIFAIMFFNVARDPQAGRGLIPYGVLLKVAYCGTVFFHWATTGIPSMWKPFAIVDVVMGALFVLAYRALGRGGR